MFLKVGVSILEAKTHEYFTKVELDTTSLPILSEREESALSISASLLGIEDIKFLFFLK